MPKFSCVLNRLLKVNQAISPLRNWPSAYRSVRARSMDGLIAITFRSSWPVISSDSIPTAIHNWMLAEADRKREKKRGLQGDTW